MKKSVLLTLFSLILCLSFASCSYSSDPETVSDSGFAEKYISEILTSHEFSVASSSAAKSDFLYLEYYSADTYDFEIRDSEKIKAIWDDLMEVKCEEKASEAAEDGTLTIFNFVFKDGESYYLTFPSDNYFSDENSTVYTVSTPDIVSSTKKYAESLYSESGSSSQESAAAPGLTFVDISGNYACIDLDGDGLSDDIFLTFIDNGDEAPSVLNIEISSDSVSGTVYIEPAYQASTSVYSAAYTLNKNLLAVEEDGSAKSTTFIWISDGEIKTLKADLAVPEKLDSDVIKMSDSSDIPLSTFKSERKYNDELVKENYGSIVSDLLAEINSSAGMASADMIEFSHGCISDFFDTGVDQMVLTYSPDNETLWADIYSFGENNYISSVQINVSLLSGGAKCEICPGRFNDSNAFYIFYSNYDGDTPFGTIYAYGLKGSGAIEELFEATWHGNAEYDYAMSIDGISYGDPVCSFGENGEGDMLYSLAF